MERPEGESKRKDEPVACAFDGCGYWAIANIKTKTGRANMCRYHYDQHYQIQADVANYERSLKTVDEMRAWCKEKLGTTRAPGDWWKAEILAKIELGERVSVAVYEMSGAIAKRYANR